MDRMGGSLAAGRCRGKTGTIDGVSNLSGYCRSGRGLVAFSLLMNGVAGYDSRARHPGQDGGRDSALPALGSAEPAGQRIVETRVRSPAQATCPSGRISTASGAATSPSTGSSHAPS